MAAAAAVMACEPYLWFAAAGNTRNTLIEVPRFSAKEAGDLIWETQPLEN